MSRKVIRTVALFTLFSALIVGYWHGFKDGKRREQIRQENKRYAAEVARWEKLEKAIDDA